MWVNAKLRHELERVRVVFPVVAEALAQLDELAIEPSRRRGTICLLLRLHLPGQLSGDEDGGSLLIETGGNVVQVLTFGPAATRRDDAHARLPRRQRERAQKLQEELLRLLTLHRHRLLIFAARIR